MAGRPAPIVPWNVFTSSEVIISGDDSSAIMTRQDCPANGTAASVSKPLWAVPDASR